MTEQLLLTRTKPIQIKTKTNYSFSNNNNNKYLFELFINGNNIKKKYFKKLECSKFCELINQTNEIKLSNIRDFKIVLTLLHSDPYIYYNMEGVISHDKNFTVYNNDILYIEFSKNINDFANCTCIFLQHDNSFNNGIIKTPS
jgi:hypothetical protein